MSFDREVMGLICLAIVWGNSLLVCAKALAELRELRRLRRQMRPLPLNGAGVGVVEGVLRSSAQDGRAAVYRLVQAARTRGDGHIYFHDRRTESSIGPALLEPQGGGRPLHVQPEGADALWVWPDPSQLQSQLQCRGTEAFDQLVAPASVARGAEQIREVDLSGQSVFVFGRLNDDASLLEAAPLAVPRSARDQRDASRPAVMLAAAYAPRRWLDAKSMLMVAALFGILLSAGALSVAALWPPVFGLVSKLGALGLLAHLLLVQPFGVWLTEQVALPHLEKIEGHWVRSQPPPTSQAAAH